MRRGAIGVAVLVALVALSAIGVLALVPGLRERVGLMGHVRYTNPVLDRDFPDPAVLRASDGAWYAYATQAFGADGAMINIQLATSRDLVNWTTLPDALPRKPRWAATTQDFWAPHVIERDGTFFMYFSGDAGDRGFCLGVATAASPRGPFVDSGAPLECGDGSIDPFAFDDPASGTRLLYWGSGDTLRVRGLAPDRKHFAPASRAQTVLEANALYDFERLIEGTWVHYRDGWYYLFYSGDNCCEGQTHYAVLVARSRSATGPYQRLAEAARTLSSVVVGPSTAWLGPGHNAVATDALGNDWIVYHAIDPARRDGSHQDLQRRLMIDPIQWTDGWPRVLDGHPSTDARRGPPEP